MSKNKVMIAGPMATITVEEEATGRLTYLANSDLRYTSIENFEGVLKIFINNTLIHESEKTRVRISGQSIGGFDIPLQVGGFKLTLQNEETTTALGYEEGVELYMLES